MKLATHIVTGEKVAVKIMDKRALGVSSPGLNFIKAQKVAQYNFANQNKFTSQTTMSHVQFVTGILLISA